MSSKAVPCDNQCLVDTQQLGLTIPAGIALYFQATETIGNDIFVIEANAGAAMRAGTQIILSPGFHAEQDSYFSASIGPCDSPGGSGAAACTSLCP